jgi:hypothetical protein
MNTKALWDQADRVFDEADKLFEEADRVFDEARKANGNVHFDNPDERKVRFRSESWKERFKHAWSFFKMTVSMIFRGHAIIVFKRRKIVK